MRPLTSSLRGQCVDAGRGGRAVGELAVPGEVRETLGVRAEAELAHELAVLIRDVDDHGVDARGHIDGARERAAGREQIRSLRFTRTERPRSDDACSAWFDTSEVDIALNEVCRSCTPETVLNCASCDRNSPLASGLNGS